jgi:hypothetical protein
VSPGVAVAGAAQPRPAPPPPRLKVRARKDTVRQIKLKLSHIIPSMQAAASHFWHFHISDSDRLPVGRGRFRIKEFMDPLSTAKFPGYVTVETFQIPDPHRSIQVSFDSLKQFFC